MNIKEACRYANFLSSTINELVTLFYSKTRFLKKTNTHLKSALGKDGLEDVVEEIDTIKGLSIPGKAEQILDCILDLIKEKATINDLIEKAKAEISIIDEWSIDTCIDRNKNLRLLTCCLDILVDMNEEELKTEGETYVFNNEGDQIVAKYDIISTTKLDYDKEKILKKKQQLEENTDLVSSLIDKHNIITNIDYTPLFNIYDSPAIIMKKYIK